MSANLIFEKDTKVFIKSFWINLSLLSVLFFRVKPPKKLPAALAQIDPEGFAPAPVSILLPPAAFLLVFATINVAQAAIEIFVRSEHCA